MEKVKIAGLSVYHLPGTRYPWVFLRLDTDEGIHGWGRRPAGRTAPSSRRPRAGSARS